MVKVFVYGSLKKGFYNHELLNDSDFIGDFVTIDKFTMFDLGAYPALMFNERGSRVSGELYEVNGSCLKRLDLLEGYPTFYNRSKIKLEDYTGGVWVYHLKGDASINAIKPNKDDLLIWE